MEGTNSKTVEREIYNMRKYKWLIIYVLLMAGILIASKTLFLNAYIPSDSMNPTLKRGDLVFSLRTATEYNRYDIAIFESPDEPSVLYIKRIIGLPGDEVDIKNGIVYVNGNEIDDSYISKEKSNYTGHFSVPDDSYFMLGDNRNHSNDSRYWKSSHFVKREKIKAVAKFRIYPLYKIGSIQY